MDISSVGHLGKLNPLELFSCFKTRGSKPSPEDFVPTPNIDSKADRDRGVLLALRNAASFYQGGKIVNVDGPKLMAEAKPYPIYPGFAFVAYPNRDSTVYKERSVFRKFILESLGIQKPKSGLCQVYRRVS